MRNIIVLIVIGLLHSCIGRTDVHVEHLEKEIDSLSQRVAEMKINETLYQDSLFALQKELLDLKGGAARRPSQPEYLYGVPPEPPYRSVEVTILDSFNEHCWDFPDEKVGYIIEINTVPYANFQLIVQDEMGVRDNYYIDTSETANAEKSWLPHVLIPGNKVRMKLYHCDIGANFLYIKHISTLRR